LSTEQQPLWIVLYDYFDESGGRFRGVFSTKEKAEDYINRHGSNAFAHDILQWNLDEEMWNSKAVEKKSGLKL
jgi:hypothetical protein